jgi:hypothetical protein
MSAPIRAFDLQRLLDDLKAKEFFGTVEIEISRGDPKVLRVAETRLFAEGVIHSDKDRGR